MNDVFQQRVRAAAVSAWWVVLLAAILLFGSYIAYLMIVPSQPAWYSKLWGPGVTWPYIQNVWFWGIVVFKIIFWTMVLAALWLTLWARQLRKINGQ